MTVVRVEKDSEGNTLEITTANRVAVYGSLRKGLSNHGLLSKSKSLGTFETLPKYNMYSVGGSFPALKNNGTTSIVMEVYEVDDKVLDRLDALEGYLGPNDIDNHYNKESISTPFGEAAVYIYNRSVNHMPRVINGDWNSFKTLHEVINA